MAVDYLNALGAGSGLDTKTIVDALVEAERAPTQSSIDRGKEKAELQISAFGLVKSSLQALKGAFDQLNDLSDLQAFTINNPASASFSMSATSAATAGTHAIQVTQLAQKDTWSSNGFATTDESLNTGSDITLTVTKGGVQTSVIVASPTPDAIVTALNDADLGFTARVVNTGTGATPYVISVAGEEGSENAFTIASDSGDVSFATQLTTAADANLTVDGVAITRSSNSITDILTGVTLNLNATMASSQTVSVANDTAPAKAAIENLVAIYNDVELIFKSLNRGADEEDELVGSLSGDSVFRQIHNTVKGMITGASSTGSGNINYFADFGVSFQRDGTLSINESKLDAALTDSFDDVVMALSAGTDNQTEYGTFDRGLAGDASKALFDLLSTTGTVNSVVTRAETSISDFEVKLEDLDARMERVYQRYLGQFTAMQQIVDQMNSTRSYLEQQLEALPFNNRD